MQSALIQALLRTRPLCLYVGAPMADASATDWKDLTGRQAAMISQVTLPPSVPVGGAGGDDTARQGWWGQPGQGYARHSGGMTGFNAGEGTILCGATLRSTATASQGLFDTAPAAVGACRVFTENNWTTIQMDIGGENNSGILAASKWSPAGGGAALLHRAMMFGFGWRSGAGNASNVLWVDAAARALANRSVGPAMSNLDWGAYNSNRSSATHHWIAMWDRFVNDTEQRTLLDAYKRAAGAHRQPRRLARR